MKLYRYQHKVNKSVISFPSSTDWNYLLGNRDDWEMSEIDISDSIAASAKAEQDEAAKRVLFAEAKSLKGKQEKTPQEVNKILEALLELLP